MPLPLTVLEARAFRRAEGAAEGPADRVLHAEWFLHAMLDAGQAIEEKGDIYLRTYKRHDSVVVEFTDTGKGISEEHLARIFDPGFTTKGAGVGTGLGLSIVYQIIKDHDGEIEVESEIGKGTTIRILLPIR